MIKCYLEDKTLLVEILSRELDHHVARDVKSEIDEILMKKQIDYIIFDFQYVNFMDSSGIGVIIGRYKKIVSHGGKIAVINMNDRLKKIFNLSRMSNILEVKFSAKSENESLSRVIVASFAAKLDPTLDELSDIKMAVSEAVTNSIVHGYEEDESKFVYLRCELEDRMIKVVIEDRGKGIEDIKQAMQPMYTSKPELDRAGMGFSFMESFMDTLEVVSIKGEGTKVVMTKTIELPK